MVSKDDSKKLTDRQKKELRIWTENGHVNYYNFKSKKELSKGVSGSVAMVDHRIVKWNSDTNRWNFVSRQQKSHGTSHLDVKM